MAKKEVVIDKKNYAEQVKKEIEEQYGKGVFESSRTIIENPKKVFKFSPALDIGLGGGIPEGCLVTCSGPEKAGKALADYELVQTPNGPVRIDSIRVGDIVCTPKGVSKVSGVFPQGKRDIYRVYFDSNDFIDCDLEHIWRVRTDYQKSRNRTLKEIIDSGLTYKNGSRTKYIIDTAKCFYNKKKVKIHPYVLGCLLGDGGLTSKNNVKFTNTDSFIIDKINSLLPKGFFLKNIKGYDIEFFLKTSGQKNVIIQYLKEYDLMYKNSHTKFIPDVYKYNSEKVRLDVVRGLMDTDGYAKRKKNAIYYTTSLRMANDMKDIISSLGGSVTIREKITKCNGKRFLSYACLIKYDEVKDLFSVPRKKDVATNRTKGKYYRTIKNIEKIGEHNATCIKIEDEDGLFLAKNCVVTHNTTSTLHFCKKFQEADPSREVYYLDAEGRLKEMNLSGIPGLDLDRFHLIHSIEGNILTAEKYLSIAEKIIHSHPGSLIVVDSISVLCPESEMTGDLTAQIRASGPRLFSLFCKRIANVLPVNRVILWGIQHLITNTSGYGAGRKEDGGVKIQYALDVKLRLKWGEDWEVGPQDNKKSIGKIAHWDIVTSALGALPNQKVDSYIRFGQGIDELKEYIEIAMSLGLIIKGGAWYSFGENKFQGEEKLYKGFLEDETMRNDMLTKVKELIA